MLSASTTLLYQLGQGILSTFPSLTCCSSIFMPFVSKSGRLPQFQQFWCNCRQLYASPKAFTQISLGRNKTPLAAKKMGKLSIYQKRTGFLWLNHTTMINDLVLDVLSFEASEGSVSKEGERNDCQGGNNWVCPYSGGLQIPWGWSSRW